MTSFQIKLLVWEEALLDCGSSIQDRNVDIGRHPTSGTGCTPDGHIAHPPRTEGLNFGPLQQYQYSKSQISIEVLEIKR